MSLPTEVVDRILSFLQSDLDILRTCAQSHPILSKLSERYIYAHISLHDDLYDTRITTGLRTSELTQTLANTPDIANHVRSLTVFCLTGNPGSKQHEATISHLNGVASLLPMFVGLTRLVIAGSWLSKSFAWPTMPETFCQAFLHYLHPQVMKDIIICNIASFPISLLNNCGNVRVTLDYCNDVQYDEVWTNPDLVQSYLEHLSIIFCSKTSVESITTWMKTHRLHSLKYVTYHSGSLQPLLVACSNSLTNLHLETPEYNNSHQFSDNSATHNGGVFPLQFTLATLRHLTQLTINAQSLLHNPEGSWTLISPISTISGLVSTAWPTLQKVSIKIIFRFDSDFEPLPDPVVIWSPFIPLAAKCSSASISLSISPTFRCLESVEMASLPGNFFSPFADYKGLTPYVQKGVVVISEDYLKNMVEL